MQMSGLFDPENAFWAFLNKLFTLMYVGFLWFVCSLPIFTIGASTTALYAFTSDMVNRREGYVGKTFFKAFKAHFLKATGLWLLISFFGLFLYYDATLCMAMNATLGKILFFGILSFSFIFLLTAVHIFPLLAKTGFTIKKLVKQAFIISMGSLPLSITLLVIHALFFIAFYFFPLIILFGFGFVATLVSMFLTPLYKRLFNVEEN